MFEDLLEFAVDYAGRLGAEYAEARFQRDLTESIILKNGFPEISARRVSKGIGVRVLVRGSLGFSSTSNLTRESIRKIVRAAVSIAKASSKLGGKISMSEEKPSKASVEVKPRIRFDAVDVDAKIDFLKEIDGCAVETCERFGVKLPSRLFEVNRWDLEKHLITSDGANVYHKIPRVMAEYLITAHSPQHGTIQRFEEFGESRGWEAIEAWKLPEKLE
ncbi:MAG TPA: TldD/PmbA family protein, partial [Nitrososphaeria archaeon]|nr:TldD/PmbA family protein [Nitrososphaeria archaeon]